MSRVFAADGHLVHDPATGLTYQSPHPHPAGRHRLPSGEVSGWPLVAAADAGREMPVSVCWSPIVRCNLHCRYCLDDTTIPEQAGHDRARIAALLGASGVLGIDISGGEPLLLKDLPDLAHCLTDGGRAAVSVTTNGWHLQRRAPELAGAFDAIRVSLDGPDPDSHDRTRGSGSFARAQAGIEAALALDIPVQIQTVLMTDNQTRAQAILNLAAAVGAGGVTFLQMLPIGAGRTTPDQMLTDTAAQRLLDALDIPAGLRVRLRTRAAAGGFTVIRADGRVWRNDENALYIRGLRSLTTTAYLTLTARDGSA